MNIPQNWFSLSAPLQSLWQWLMAEPGQHLRQHQPVCRQRVAPVVGIGQETTDKANMRTQTSSSTRAHQRPVRVLQVMDVGQNPNHTGRLRISGRMADVCAELDRLAAREILLN